MRVGPKKALSLLRWGAPGVSGPYTVERPQDRETYQDGDHSLSDQWMDRPYQDVEQPHMDADPDLDAEESGKPIKRLNTESVVRQAVMEMVTEGEEKEKEKEKERHLDTSGAFSGPLWGRVAPLVNTVLDLMRMNQDGDQLKSNLESSNIRRKELIWAVAKKAELFGFGYRTAKKDWGSFMELVPAVTGMLKDDHNRELLENALGEWVSEEGQIRQTGFAGAPDPEDWGFKPFVPFSGGGADTQEYYEGYIPGAVPRQETYNVERIVNLARGNITGKMISGLRDRLEQRMIVDFSTARVNTHRLQSLLRYVTDQPDSQLALAIVVGTIVREAVRQAGEGGEEAIKFNGGRVSLNINPSQLLDGMQGGTRRIIDEWLSMAVSMMRIVGVLPVDKPRADEEDTEYLKADMSKYQSLRDRMRVHLADIALKIATKALQGLHDRPDEIEDEPDEPDKVRAQDIPDKNALRRPVVVLVEEVDELAPDAAEALESFDEALAGNCPTEAAQAAQALYGIASGSGASPGNLSAVAQVIDALKVMATDKAASTTVADIAKRIVAPAKVRVVTQDEAEDGIELPDGGALELPDRYHAVRRTIGG